MHFFLQLVQHTQCGGKAAAASWQCSLYKAVLLSLFYKHYLHNINEYYVCLSAVSSVLHYKQPSLCAIHTVLAKQYATDCTRKRGESSISDTKPCQRGKTVTKKKLCCFCRAAGGFCAGKVNKLFTFLNKNRQYNSQVALNKTNEPRTVPVELHSRQPSSLSMCSCVTDKQHDYDENEHALSANLPWMKKQNPDS